jgi:hypothetical protein
MYIVTCRVVLVTMTNFIGTLVSRSLNEKNRFSRLQGDPYEKYVSRGLEAPVHF